MRGGVFYASFLCEKAIDILCPKQILPCLEDKKTVYQREEYRAADEENRLDAVFFLCYYMPMIILNVSGINLSFGITDILTDISFSVNEGDRVGIIGVNGAGKTSLFRVITGEYKPDGGALYMSKEKTVGLLSQNANIEHADEGDTVLSYMLSVFPEALALEGEIERYENELSSLPETESAAHTLLSQRLAQATADFCRIDGPQFRSRCESLLIKTGFPREDFGKRINELSGGQRTRLALAHILYKEPDLLLLDEPTNHLDYDTMVWLEGYLSSYRKTLLVISHDRYFLDRVTNKTLILENRRAKLYPGNYSKAQDLRNAERDFEEKQYQLQEKEIARYRAIIAKQKTFGMERNYVTIRSREKAIERMKKYSRPEGPQKNIRLAFSSTREAGGNEVLEARELCGGYGDNILFRNVNFLISRGERVFIIGANGTGKSTLLKMICARLSPLSGALELGYNIKTGYYDQENQGLDESLSVFEEFCAAFPQMTEGEVRKCLALFLFTGEDVFKLISDLSGGERARLTLAKLVSRKVNLLVLDEPTNHLDISSREALESALSDYEGTVICVSHDRFFTDRLATRILELNPASEGGIVSYPLSADGGYQEYLALREEKKAERARKEAEAARTQNDKTSKNDYLKNKEELAKRRKDERDREKAALRVKELEELLPKLEAELYGEAACDYIKAAELHRKIEETEEELLSLYEILDKIKA